MSFGPYFVGGYSTDHVSVEKIMAENSHVTASFTRLHGFYRYFYVFINVACASALKIAM
jgi:hypothetical protein